MTPMPGKPEHNSRSCKYHSVRKASKLYVEDVEGMLHFLKALDSFTSAYSDLNTPILTSKANQTAPMPGQLLAKSRICKNQPARNKHIVLRDQCLQIRQNIVFQMPGCAKL
ncbi:hypothetical protein RRG08_027911 [Elysia crispata]|uniref:Uncharacterized protein n=1 Tax=Elysia crispata TaxID=231223 RepID=A0AAE1A6S2_9GAST|nr:hypothetical protein RRG08_027911 [Elysia crispata]